MERNAGHYMDEQTGNLIEAVKNHRVPPHCYSDGVVSESQTVCTDEESFRLREEPDGEHAEKIYKIAEIC